MIHSQGPSFIPLVHIFDLLDSSMATGNRSWWWSAVSDTRAVAASATAVGVSTECAMQHRGSELHDRRMAERVKAHYLW